MTERNPLTRLDAVLAKTADLSRRVDSLVERRADAEFNESDHPRDPDGKFGSGGGGGAAPARELSPVKQAAERKRVKRAEAEERVAFGNGLLERAKDLDKAMKKNGGSGLPGHVKDRLKNATAQYGLAINSLDNGMTYLHEEKMAKAKESMDEAEKYLKQYEASHSSRAAAAGGGSGSVKQAVTGPSTSAPASASSSIPYEGAIREYSEKIKQTHPGWWKKAVAQFTTGAEGWDYSGKPKSEHYATGSDRELHELESAAYEAGKAWREKNHK